MQVGVKSEWKIPERLYGDNSTGYRLLVPDAGCVKGFQRLPAIPPGREGQKAGCGRKENTAAGFWGCSIPHACAEPPLPPPDKATRRTLPPASGDTPRVFPAGTGWTEMATLARKCQEIFMTTVLTSDPGKAIFQRPQVTG